MTMSDDSASGTSNVAVQQTLRRWRALGLLSVILATGVSLTFYRDLRAVRSGTEEDELLAEQAATVEELEEARADLEEKSAAVRQIRERMALLLEVSHVEDLRLLVDRWSDFDLPVIVEDASLVECELWSCDGTDLPGVDEDLSISCEESCVLSSQQHGVISLVRVDGEVSGSTVYELDGADCGGQPYKLEVTFTVTGVAMTWSNDEPELAVVSDVRGLLRQRVAEGDCVGPLRAYELHFG